MYLVQQQNRSASLRVLFCLRPTAFPETRKAGVRLVASSIHSSVAEFLGDFEEKRRLADLPRAQQQGVVVCRSSRVASGRVVRGPALIRRGMVAADNLPPWKARILLALALTATRDPAEIQRLFDTH